MKLTDRIRNMATQIEVQDIAISLGLPIELVEGIINGTVDESALKDYDPASQVTIVDKHIITRGHILAVLQNSQLAAEMAVCLSDIQPTAVIDLEKFSTLPIHLGIDIKNIPKAVNYLWDDNITRTAYKNNLYVYALPRQSKVDLNLLYSAYPTVIINCSVEQMDQILPAIDMFYIPTLQDDAGIYRLYQISAQYKQYENRTQIVWLCKNNNEKYLSQLRSFSSAHIAGCFDVNGSNKQIGKILEPLLPVKKKRRWFA